MRISSSLLAVRAVVGTSNSQADNNQHENLCETHDFNSLIIFDKKVGFQFVIGGSCSRPKSEVPCLKLGFIYLATGGAKMFILAFDQSQ